MATEWYYAQDGKQIGPVSSDDLKLLVQSGTLTPESLLWQEGMADWKPAGGVRGLFGSAEKPATGANSTLPPPPRSKSLATTVSSTTLTSAPGLPEATKQVPQSEKSGGESQGAMALLLGWYKRYVVFILSLSWSVVTATWYAATVLVGDLKRRWKSVQLKGDLEKQKIALGEKLFSTEAGNAQLRKQIAAKDQEIQQATANKDSTTELVAGRRSLLAELADAALAAPTPSADVQIVRQAEDALKKHEQEVAAIVSTRPPIDQRRAWIGGLIGLLILAAAAGKDENGESESFLPHIPGTSREYVQVIYPPDGPATALMLKVLHKDNGEIEKTTVKLGRLNGSKGLFDGGEVEWLKDVTIPSKFPHHHRVNGEFIEEGSHPAENGTITWEPVLKVGAKPDDSWEWNPSQLFHKRYTVTKRTEWNGKAALVVREESPFPGGGTTIVFHTYAAGVGLVDSYGSRIQIGMTPAAAKTYEKKLVDSSKTSSSSKSKPAGSSKEHPQRTNADPEYQSGYNEGYATGKAHMDQLGHVVPEAREGAIEGYESTLAAFKEIYALKAQFGGDDVQYHKGKVDGYVEAVKSIGLR